MVVGMEERKKKLSLLVFCFHVKEEREKGIGFVSVSYFTYNNNKIIIIIISFLTCQI
jgi:hypothetical protein